MPPLNYYPYGGYQYLPQIPQYTQSAPAQTTPQISTGILWVANEQEAQNYPVAPNNAVALWDSVTPVIYLKQADASGRPNIKVYDLKERIDQTTPEISNVNYAEKSELESLRTELKNIKKELTALKRKQEDEDD